MNYLQRGLRRTLQAIRKHKFLFCSIMLLQIIFIVLFAWLGVSSVVEILENTRAIIEPFSNATYDAQKIQEGTPFTGDFRSIYNNYNSMLENIKFFALKSLIVFIIGSGLLWLGTFSLLEEKRGWKKKVQKALQFWFKMIVSAVLFFGPFLVLAYYILLRFIHGSSESFQDVILLVEVLMTVLVLIYYFFLTALATANEVSWKKHARTWILISFAKIKQTFPLFIIILAALSLSSLALYAAIIYEQSIALLLVTGLLEITTIVITRLFWVASIYELKNEP